MYETIIYVISSLKIVKNIEKSYNLNPEILLFHMFYMQNLSLP